MRSTKNITEGPLITSSAYIYIVITIIYFPLFLYQISGYDPIQCIFAIVTCLSFYSFILLFIHVRRNQINYVIFILDFLASGFSHVSAFLLRHTYAAYYFPRIQDRKIDTSLYQDTSEAIISTILSSVFYFGWVHTALLILAVYFLRQNIGNCSK